MKVWVVEGVYDYEGFDIVAICVTEEKALSVKFDTEKCRCYDDVKISVHEVV